MTIVHFINGPLDGELLERQDTPLLIYIPEALEIALFHPDDNGPEQQVPCRTVAYRRRGPTLRGDAYYDFQP